jgi:hypothetical protein
MIDATPLVSPEGNWDETYLRNQDLVTGGDTHGDAVAVLGQETGANGENLSLVLLLDAALGEEDARGGLGLGLDALDQDAVEEGSEALDVAEDRLLRPESVCCARQREGVSRLDSGLQGGCQSPGKEVNSKEW